MHIVQEGIKEFRSMSLHRETLKQFLLLGHILESIWLQSEVAKTCWRCLLIILHSIKGFKFFSQWLFFSLFCGICGQREIGDF